jgi:hypothetical protein
MVDRTQKIQNVLAHMDRYPDPGSIIDALKQYDPQYIDPQQYKAGRQQQLAALAQAQQKFDSEKAKMSPQERGTTEISLSLGQQVYSGPDAFSMPADVYFVSGEHGGDYVKARAHRAVATIAFTKAVDREVDDGGDDLARAFTLTDGADDFMAFAEAQWTVSGDVATAPPPGNNDPSIFWMPPLRKVGNDWKIDITEETDGDVAAAAIRAEQEAQSLEAITRKVNAMHFDDLDQVRAALRAAGIRGTGKSMN